MAFPSMQEFQEFPQQELEALFSSSAQPLSEEQRKRVVFLARAMRAQGGSDIRVVWKCKSPAWKVLLQDLFNLRLGIIYEPSVQGSLPQKMKMVFY